MMCGLLAVASAASGQPPDLQSVLQRLDRLEEQNQELMAELRALRQGLGRLDRVQTWSAGYRRNRRDLGETQLSGARLRGLR